MNKENIPKNVLEDISSDEDELHEFRIQRQPAFVGKGLYFEMLTAARVLKADIHGKKILSYYKKNKDFAKPAWARNKISELIVKDAVKVLKRYWIYEYLRINNVKM